MKLDLLKFAASPITSTTTTPTGNGILGGENAGSVNDGGIGSVHIPSRDTGSARVEYDLERVNAAYKALARLEKESEANAAKLSDLSLMDGIDDDGNYSEALKCIKGVNGLPGNTGSALDRAREVRRALLEAEGISEKLFDDLDDPNYNSDDFGEDLNQTDERPDGSLPGYNSDGSPKNQQTGPMAGENPSTPTNPGKPSQPPIQDPTGPMAGETPGTPTTPGKPSQPPIQNPTGPMAGENPSTPTNPGKPSQPPIQNPTGPMAGETPGTPTTPGKPSQPPIQDPTGPSAEESHPAV